MQSLLSDVHHVVVVSTRYRRPVSVVANVVVQYAPFSLICFIAFLPVVVMQPEKWPF